ncbi:hypothetical protein RGR602_CH03188 [Rhizobium gallicum bv. gallicum R602sp]|uniref:Uncharacterized protein n=1 Tax=Rhizobium gallicum bv. gallicum R602sp TaxID=1041138 RepID=A0A0B4X318_9HYPH|nr:hypothetical protein RGR602_CH03188 [Rhizobium gallicum bv. gallicum R602sp]
MFPDCFALGALVFVFLTLFHAVSAIHDIPHLMAKARNNPHQDAVHVAGWVSLFTLNAIWPFLFFWATIAQRIAQGQLQLSGASILPQSPKRVSPEQTFGHVDCSKTPTSTNCPPVLSHRSLSIPNTGTASQFFGSCFCV